MHFKRDWIGSQIYKQWEADGATWTVEDLHPIDDELALALLYRYFIYDEEMTRRVEIINDDVSSRQLKKHWKAAIAGRTSLACYYHSNGLTELAGFNVCPVKSIDDEEYDYTKDEGDKWRCLIGMLTYFDTKVNIFDELDVTKYLSGAGLLVMPRFRGLGIGAKILDAREPLCRQLGIYGTATVFTGIGSQKSAARSGFQTAGQVTFEEYGKAGLYSPGDQTKIVKLMIKKYH